MKTILKKMYWWLISTVSNLRFVIISRKEYLSLRDKAAELGKKLTDLKILQSKYDFVVVNEKCLLSRIRVISSRIEELEKIAANYAHKKELAKARRKKYEAKKRFQKKEVAAQVAVSKPVYQAAPMSEVEKFARENLGRKVILKAGTGKCGDIGFVAGYKNGEIGYILIGFAGLSGWNRDRNFGVTLSEHKSYWWVKIDEIIFN